MRILALSVLALAALTPAATAQVISETNGMTVPNSMIDMDNLPLGPTDVALLNAAGTNGGATMANLTMTAKTTAAQGIYNTNVCGYALAAGPNTGNALYIVDDSGGAVFDAMTVSIDFGGQVTEFGMLLADWVSPAYLEFYSGGVMVANHTSSSFSSACLEQYYQMTGGTFDRVDIDVTTTAGNWCLPTLFIEQTGPPGPTLSVANLVAGGTVTISADNCTPGGLVRHGYSVFGGGPIGTPYGDLLLSPPYTELPAMTCDASGSASMAAPVPPGTTGIQVWLHAMDMGSLTFTNGLFEIIG